MKEIEPPYSNAITLTDLPFWLQEFSRNYCKESGLKLMIIGSFALKMLKVPVTPNDVDIVLSKISYTKYQPYLHIIENSEELSILFLEDEMQMPFFGHIGKFLDLQLCYNLAISNCIENDFIVIPPLDVLLILYAKKVDDALFLAKIAYDDPRDSYKAERRLYRSLEQLSALVSLLSESLLTSIKDTFSSLRVDWFLPWFYKVFSLLENFLRFQGASALVINRAQEIPRIIQFTAQKPNASLATTFYHEFRNTLLNDDYPPPVVSQTPTDTIVSFKGSGNVYRIPFTAPFPVYPNKDTESIHRMCSNVRIVHFQTTNICPLRCTHCHFEKGNSCMDFQLAKQLLASFSEAGILEVDFGEGGEALCYPNLSELIEITHTNFSMTPNLSSNLAIPLTDDLSLAIKRYVGEVAVSIDRYHYGDFKKTGIPQIVERNILSLIEDGVKISVNYVYNPQYFSVTALEDIYWFASRNIRKVTLLREYPFQFEGDDVSITNSMQSFFQISQDLDVDIGFATCDPILNTELLCDILRNQGFDGYSKCTAGQEFVFVDLKGRIGPCGHCPPELMKQFDSFSDVLTKNELRTSFGEPKGMHECPYQTNRKILERR
jgi:MoaA/NifB/PqqE/SkfB family radical SAM enzyme